MAKANKTATKKPAAKKTAEKKTAKVEATKETSKNRLPEFLIASNEGWRSVRQARIEFAKENANTYFENLQARNSAKNFSEANALRSEFTMNAVLRRIEQEKEVGQIAQTAGKNAWDVLDVKLPSFNKKAA